MSLINGLPAIISELESKSVYVNLFSHKHMTIEFLFSLCTEGNHVSLSCFTDKETLLSGLNNQALQMFSKLSSLHLSKAYFINHKTLNNKTSPVALAKDIINTNISKNSRYILLIPDSMLAQCSEQEISKFLGHVSVLAQDKKLTVNVCIYGNLAISLLKPKLIASNRFIAGLATVSAVDENRYSYFVDFWSNRLGVRAEQEYLLSLNEGQVMYATPVEKSKLAEITEDRSDSERIYISREALGENSNIAKGMIVAKTNQQLLEMLDSPRSSTLIFGCARQSDVQFLALECFKLRTKAGARLKIIVRETQQCLRYADEKFLIRAGVNLICPVQLPQMRFMTQVEAIQGQVLTREMPMNLDSLLKYHVDFGSKGYLTSRDFSEYCTDLITRSTRSKVNFALIKLNLLPGMTAEECLRLCNIRRDGDVVTACNTALYVLFSAIRHDDIDTALNNIFEFPIHDLFHSTSTLDTLYEIEAELKLIIKEEAAIAKEVSALTTEKQIFAPSNIAMTDVPALFAVKKTISIKE